MYAERFLKLKRLVSSGSCGLALAAGIAAGGASSADRSPGAFERIAAQNIFRLKPPEVVRIETPPPVLPKVIMTGITTLLGNKRVLLKLLPPNPGPASRELLLILSEGQRDAEVEVVSIDERAGSVRILNSGTPMTLTFDRDGARLPPTLPPVAAPAPASATSPTRAASPVVTRARMPADLPPLPPEPGDGTPVSR